MASKAVIKRTEIEHYMNLGTTEESPDFKRMGDGWTKVDDGSSANTESVKYINQDVESTDTVSYTGTYSVECDLMYADPTIKKVYDIYKNRLTGGDCEVEMITVEKFNKNNDGSYVARKELVAVAISGTSENNNKMKMSGNLNVKGNPVKGKAVIGGDGTVTFTAEAKEE